MRVKPTIMSLAVWKRPLLVFTLGVLALAMAGCQSSGVAQRRAQRPEAYQSLDPATRKLVNQGRIQNGMDTNSVFIAWGQPTDAFSIAVPGGGQRLIWNYEEKWAYEFKRRTPPFGYATPPSTDQTERTRRWRVPITYVAKSVTFTDGKVIEWKKHDPPAYSQPTDVSPETGRRF